MTLYLTLGLMSTLLVQVLIATVFEGEGPSNLAAVFICRLAHIGRMTEFPSRHGRQLRNRNRRLSSLGVYAWRSNVDSTPRLESLGYVR